MALRSMGNAGFTLIEIIMVILLISVLAGTSVVTINRGIDAQRFEETRRKLELIKTAILGDDAVDGNGQRIRFGYHGDMGRVPGALARLGAQGGDPTWSFDTLYAIGVGWRGSYLSTEVSGGIAVDRDAWNRALVYSTGGNATITSYGADGAAGGAGYNSDITVVLPTTGRFATVSGVVADKEVRADGATVTIAFASNGGIATSSATATSIGGFSFSGIPYGLSSLLATVGTQTLGPNRVTVANSSATIPPSALDWGGKFNVSYTTTPSAAAFAAPNLDFYVYNHYPTTLTLSYLTVTWTAEAYLTQVIVDPAGAAQTQSVANLPSGVRFPLTSSLTVPAGARLIRLVFSASSNGTGTADLADSAVQVGFEWSGLTKFDGVSFTIP